MNMELRKSPKLSRANQEGQRSPRLPTKKPPVRSPSLTRREFSMDGITEVQTSNTNKYPTCMMIRCWYIINHLHCFKLSFCLLQSTTIWLRLLPTSGGQNSKLSDLPHFCPPILVQVSLTGHSHTHTSLKTFKITFCYISVIYKTSLLHLQPRQMTIYLPEVRKISHDFMSLPVFNPNVFSEDEDDLPGSNN